MTLATGNNLSRRVRSGVSLIELLLVLALITIAGSVVIINFVAFTDRGDSTSPEEVLTAAIRQARFSAAADRVTTRLRYDQESGSLQIIPGGESFHINADFGPGGRGVIRFFLVPPGEGLSPLPDPQRSTLQVPAVAFAPDRSSSPFVVEIDSGSGTPTRLRYDPFSSVIRTEQ